MKRWLPIGLGVIGLLLAGYILFGMLTGPKQVAPGQVLWMPWLAVGLTAAAIASCWSTVGARLGSFLGLALGAQSGSALACISLAVAAGRQNYWDAVHFASLYWVAVVGSLGALVLLVRVARGGSELARFLAVLSGLLLGACVVLWAWMTLGPVQELQGWIARTLYLLTHG